MTAVSLNEKAPATPAAAATTPITEITKFVTPDKAVKGGVSVPSNSIPYYATPKIMVHKPSQSSETEASGSRTIDEVLGKERRASFQQELPRDTDLYSATPILRLVPVSPRSTEIQAQDIPNELKLKKRKRYLRKLRNAAARPTILKASLGRQLATPTKQALRILAIGESVTVEGLTELTVPTKQAERLLAEGQNITLERLAESAISPKQAQMLAADGENFTNIALKGFAVCS